MENSPHNFARAAEVLEFSAVQNALAERAATGLGRERAQNIAPSNDVQQIQLWLSQLEDALFGTKLNLGGITDIRPLLQHLQNGQLVETTSLVEVADSLEAAMTLKRSVAQHSRGPLLVLAEKIGAHEALTRNIHQSLDRDGRVRDDATPRLRQIRRRQEPLRGEIRNKLGEMLNRYGEAIQEHIITIRRDRYVIPVKSNFESAVPGIVVDSSATGQTLFMEPASIVPLNNELAKLLIEDAQEVARIVFELAKSVREETGIEETLHAVGELDVLAAKASLCRDWNLNAAEILTNTEFEFESLRHPLIANCVPNDVALNTTRRILLITGPNMGGKTVTLKAFGLACLMTQIGLHVAAFRARVPILHNMLVDMGDEQSIQQNLSTFAAHLKNLAEIVEHANSNTLVLIDELGSGTDPNEGAALAQAILEHLLNAGARGIITTHLAPLKAFANEREDVVNASMGFELGTLRSNFKLQIGQPGRSFAIAVARRLGFPEHVMKRSEELLGPENMRLENLLAALEEERKLLAQQMDVTRHAEQLAQIEANTLRQQQQVLENTREEQIFLAKQQAEKIYTDAFEQVRLLKLRAQETGERGQIMETLRELRANTKPVRPQKPNILASSKPTETDQLKPGARVDVLSHNASGTILELRGQTALVQMGVLKISVPLTELKTKAKQKPSQSIGLGKSNFENELNVRAQRAEEALEAVRDFIAEATALREQSVRILHGKGEGILRQLIRQQLKGDKRVQSFHDAAANEGGHGVTVANLKNQ